MATGTSRRTTSETTTSGGGGATAACFFSQPLPRRLAANAMAQASRYRAAAPARAGWVVMRTVSPLKRPVDALLVHTGCQGVRRYNAPVAVVQMEFRAYSRPVNPDNASPISEGLCIAG